MAHGGNHCIALAQNGNSGIWPAWRSGAAAVSGADLPARVPGQQGLPATPAAQPAPAATTRQPAGGAGNPMQQLSGRTVLAARSWQPAPGRQQLHPRMCGVGGPPLQDMHCCTHPQLSYGWRHVQRNANQGHDPESAAGEGRGWGKGACGAHTGRGHRHPTDWQPVACLPPQQPGHCANARQAGGQAGRHESTPGSRR